MDTEIKRATRVEQVTLEDGRTGWKYSDGVVRDENGRAMTLPKAMEKHKITQANTSEFLARRREIGLASQLRGLARANGHEPPDDATIEELARLAGTAVEKFTAHMGETFLKSQSLRGMGEVYNKLVQPLTGDQREKAEIEQVENVNILVLLAQHIQQYYPSTDTRNENGDVIDVKPEE